MSDVIRENIEEHGFLGGIYAEGSVEAAKELAQDKFKWYPFKNGLRQEAKQTDGVTVSVVDEWASAVESEAKQDNISNGLTLEDGDQMTVAKHLYRQMNDGTRLVYDYSRFYQYDVDERFWKPLGKNRMHKEVFGYSEARIVKPKDDGTLKDCGKLSISSGFVDGVVNIIKREADVSKDINRDGFFDSAPKGILYNDCFLKVEDGRVEIIDRPDANLRQTFKVDANFKSGDVETPLFDEYMETTFEGDADAEEKKKLLLEFAGAALAGVGVDFEKAIVLYDNTTKSGGANGKSVFIKILDQLFPQRVVTSEDPTGFDDKNVRAALAGKRLNISAEMPEDSGVIDGQAVKSFITGDRVSAELKFKDRFSYLPTCSHLFACNNFPHVKDDSEAFWRRWIVVPFNNRFTGSDRKVGLDKDIVEQEGQAILVKLGHALMDLVARGGFSETSGCDQAKSLWRRQSNPIEKFLMDCVEGFGEFSVVGGDDEKEHWTKSSRLYKVYHTWANTFGFHPVSETKFGRRLSARLLKKRKNDGNYYQCKLKDQGDMPHSASNRGRGF